jgi:hypothetical protein
MDMAAYFERVRPKILLKAVEPYQIRKNAFDSNISEFERTLTRKARSEGASTATAVAKAFEGIRANGNRIPDVFKIEGVDDKVYAESYAAAIKNQEAAEAAFIERMKPLGELYIKGIQLEIDRQGNDPGAANALREEIERVKEDPAYLPSVLPQDPMK